MSKSVAADLAIQWTSRGVTVYDARTRSTSHSLDGLSGRTSILALGRRNVFLKATRLPNAAPEELRQILSVRIGELFPLPAASLAFDFIGSDDVADGGRLFMVAAVPAAELRTATDQLRDAGIKVVRTVPAALGSVGVAQELGMAEAGIVQPTDEGVAIDIVSHGLVAYSRVVGAGAEIAADVCRTFTVAGLPCKDIVAAGGIALPDSDRQTLHHSLEALTSGPLPELDLILPEVRFAREKAKRTGKQRQAGLLALSAAVMGMFVWNTWDEASAVVRRQETRDAAKLRQFNGVLKAKEADAAKAAALESQLKRAFEPGQTLADLMKVVSNRTPDGVWLSGISVERGKPIQIRGTSRNSQGVADYVKMLSAQPRLRDVKLVFANDAKIDETPVVQFSVSAVGVGNLPVVESARSSGGANR